MNADEMLDIRDDRLELQRLKQLNAELLEALIHLVMAINRGIPIYPMRSSVNQLMPQTNAVMTTQEAEAVIRKASA